MTTKEFPEDLVLATILEQSDLFRRFYEQERSKLTKPIRWVRNTSLPEGIEGRSTRGDREDTVLLNVVPAEDPVLVAHELMHLIMDTEGYPITGGAVVRSRPSNAEGPQGTGGLQKKTLPYDFESLSAALNGMLHHPVVHQKLHLCGFDLSETYQQELNESKRQLRRRSGEPTGRFERAHWTFNYVDKVLSEPLLGQDEAEGQRSGLFQEWFDQRFTTIARAGKNLVGFVQARGFHSPQEQEALFRDLITRFNLSAYVRLFRGVRLGTT